MISDGSSTNSLRRQDKTADWPRVVLRRVWRLRHQMWDWLVDSVLYARERLMGGRFVDFYAAKMDRLADAAPRRATGTPERKRFQFEYLLRHGLRPTTSFLDYGCGTAAAGIHMIDFLDAGRYVGADISAGCLDVARHRVTDAGLDARKPTFVHLPSGALGDLSGYRFDIIWAQSVLTHMPPDDIVSLLGNLRVLLGANGVFYATFAHLSRGIRQRRIKDWYYSVDAFNQLASRAGYRCTLMTDWRHPDGDVDRLACLIPVND